MGPGWIAEPRFRAAVVVLVAIVLIGLVGYALGVADTEQRLAVPREFGE